MQTRRVEFTARGRSLAEETSKEAYSKGDALSPLLFVIAMMPLNHIFRKYTVGYKLTKSQETVNYLMYMNVTNLFAQNEKELETLIQTVRIYRQNIEIEFSMEKRTIQVRKMANGPGRKESNYQIKQ